VGEYIAEFKRIGPTYQDIARMIDTEVMDLFEKSNKSANPMYEDLSKDFHKYKKQLARTGVTLYLLWEELGRHNDALFQKREISRRQLFNEIGKSELQPLPVERCELKHYQMAMVEFNHHVYLKEGRHYAMFNIIYCLKLVVHRGIELFPHYA